MTIQIPDGAVAVDPGQVALELRQMHAQHTDALANEVATLRVAVRDLQATAQEARIRAEELGAENAQLRQEIEDLKAKKRSPLPDAVAAKR